MSVVATWYGGPFDGQEQVVEYAERCVIMHAQSEILYTAYTADGEIETTASTPMLISVPVHKMDDGTYRIVWQDRYPRL